MIARQTTDIENIVLELLRNRPKKACFITEVRAALAPYNLGSEAMEQALGGLEARGAVIIRDHYCADPHLDGVDLRVVARVDPADDQNPELAAIQEIDKAWDHWLTSYLANHRCS